MKSYFAHSENEKGQWQTMKEHATGVSEFMKEFAISKEYADLYEFCGLIHDMGKYSEAFQRHIAGEVNNVKHSIYGAMYAVERRMLELALPVYGHHAGIPDRPDMIQNIKAELVNGQNIYETICKAWKNDMGKEYTFPNDDVFRKIPDVFQQELFVRLMFSSLVDADSLDTERHFREDIFATRTHIPLDVNVLLDRLQLHLNNLGKDEKKGNLPINKLREEVRLYAESKATLPQGFFSLTLPTGLGKTICSMSWALHHAQHHKNVKRIIVVLPFISIIDQTAEIFKSIFNNGDTDYILEHHSNVIYEEDENETISPKQLATENWEYPIIITTSVQFFESLFSNKRSVCRKLHNIENSIIIFDEIQTLPLSVSEPTIIMLNNLQQLCRCSILFCTATQPDYHLRKGFRGISKIESLVKSPQSIFENTRRVTYQSINDYNQIELEDLVAMVMDSHRSSLVVFNTKKKAHSFYEKAKELCDCKVFHLSTTMCPIHRKNTIKEIRIALDEDKTIIVSSTQLIEAGVDMDFPSVYRELAPLESIIQSAGRCNREGGPTDNDGAFIRKGSVFLFALTDTAQPSAQYRSWTEFANLLYKGNEDKLYTHDFYTYYYNKLTELYADTDKYKITEDRQKLYYQTVSEKYKLIDSKTTSLFIYKYDNNSLKLYHSIKNRELLSRKEYQQVSQYCVQVYDRFLKDNNSFIGEEPCGILVWHGDYSPECGLPFIEEPKALII